MRNLFSGGHKNKWDQYDILCRYKDKMETSDIIWWS